MSENRKCFQTDTFRSFETLPNVDSESPLKSILKFSDNTLSAQNSQEILADNFVLVVLIPLVGAFEIVNDDISKIIDSGEIAYILMKTDEQILIQNPYENELINYLEIWINSEDILEENLVIKKFNLDKDLNNLIDVSLKDNAKKFYIGKFDGREEGVLKIDKQAIVFVIHGVFECENRLLESRSALAILGTDEIEFEGLGRENIILIIS